MKQIFVFIFIVAGISCTTSYRSTPKGSFRGNAFNPPPGKPGSCYAKAITPDKFISVEKNYIKYLGNDFDNPYVKKEKIVLKGEESAKWVKRKADKNCLSSDPEDCYVWCLEKQPERYVEYYAVTDTFMVEEFEVVTETFKIIDTPGGNREWVEVLCQKDIDSDFLFNLSQQLSERGYEHTFQGKFDSSVQLALTTFQKNHQLPVGQLDFRTLDYLGINY